MSLSEKLYQQELNRTREIIAEPLWYKEVYQENRARKFGKAAISAALDGVIVPHEVKEAMKDFRYSIYEQLLEEGAVALGKEGYDWDSEREPVDTLVIHHTSGLPGMSRARLNAMHLLRIYVPAYANPSEPDIPRVTDRPIYSGHYDRDQQVFYGYHWLIRTDGEAERLLSDDAIGWHAANWEVNKRSIAFCIDDDLEDQSPSQAVLESIAEVTKAHYGQVDISPQTVVGHGEVSLVPTDCPGNEFLPTWKTQLIQKMES